MWKDDMEKEELHEAVVSAPRAGITQALSGDSFE